MSRRRFPVVAVVAAVAVTMLFAAPANPAFARAAAADAAGGTSANETVASATPQFPGPPAVTDLWPTRATLTWQPPNTDPMVTYYRIYRVTTLDGQPYEQFYNASYSTSLLLALLTPNTEYTFFVETGDQTSNGLRSPRLTFRTPPAPAEANPPTPPGTPVATVVAPGSVTLRWAPAVDDTDVAAYHVYPSSYGQTGSPATTITATTWTFSRLLPDYDYAYHVIAVDHSGNRSAPSGTLSLRTPADPAASCQSRYATTDYGNGTFLGALTLRNTGPAAEVYTIRLRLPAGQRITMSWDLAWRQVGDEVVFWYDGWSGGLGSGPRTFQFVASRTGTGPIPPATAHRFNGQPCAAL